MASRKYKALQTPEGEAISVYVKEPEVWLTPGNQHSTNLAVIKLFYLDKYRVELVMDKAQAEKMRNELDKAIKLM